MAMYKAPNPRPFPVRLIGPADIDRVVLSPAKLGGTADRELRTILDDSRAPFSALTVGEVVNGPGKWSSFPPHHHPQWEIYHFRFFPKNGFAFSEQGEDVFKVRDGDTAVIPPGLTHPQCAAPGYAMVYLWAIRHLEGCRFGADSRNFVAEHAWTLG
jgi:5-deoxy-glucuronate isomerase